MVTKPLESPARSPSRTFLLCAVVVAFVQLGILWGTGVPLGVPGEWTWSRTDFKILHWDGIWPAIVAGLLLCGFVSWTALRIDIASKVQRSLALFALWIIGTVWFLSVVASAPEIAGLSRAPFVLYYTRSSGYFTQARDEVKDLHQFLSTYKNRIQDSNQPENYLHMGTHPPGLTTAFVLIIDLCEGSAGFRNAILATQPTSVRESFANIPHDLSPEAKDSWEVDQAVIWLTTLIVALSAAGTCIPLYLLIRRTASVEAAWWGAAIWLLVPATAIFFPKSDSLFPCLAMWVQWLWLEGVDRRSYRFGAAAGAAIFLAVCLSLAFAPIGLMLLLQGIFVSPIRESGSATNRRWFGIDPARLKVYFSSAAVFGLLLLGARIFGGINLIEVWVQNLKNHAAFYSHATRSYLPWLLMNPLELGFALGLPLALLSACGLWNLIASRFQTDRIPVREGRPAPFVLRPSYDLLIPVIVWAVLWISGKNMGEAARLWIFLMPYAVWLAALAIDRMLPLKDSYRRLTILFLLQMIVCIGTVIRIDGFHFAELVSK